MRGSARVIGLWIFLHVRKSFPQESIRDLLMKLQVIIVSLRIWTRITHLAVFVGSDNFVMIVGEKYFHSFHSSPDFPFALV